MTSAREVDSGSEDGDHVTPASARLGSPKSKSRGKAKQAARFELPDERGESAEGADRGVHEPRGQGHGKAPPARETPHADKSWLSEKPPAARMMKRGVSDFFSDKKADSEQAQRHTIFTGKGANPIMRANTSGCIEPTSVGFAPTPMRSLNMSSPKADPSARRLVRQATMSIRGGAEAMTMAEVEFDGYDERSTPKGRGGGGPPRSPVGAQSSQFSQGGTSFNGLKSPTGAQGPFGVPAVQPSDMGDSAVGVGNFGDGGGNGGSGKQPAVPFWAATLQALDDLSNDPGNMVHGDGSRDFPGVHMAFGTGD